MTGAGHRTTLKTYLLPSPARLTLLFVTLLAPSVGSDPGGRRRWKGRLVTPGNRRAMHDVEWR